jgi:hypothetical protein
MDASEKPTIDRRGAASYVALVAAGRSLSIGAAVSVGWPRAINQSVYLPWGKALDERDPSVGACLPGRAYAMLRFCVQLDRVGVHLLLARAAARASTTCFLHCSL